MENKKGLSRFMFLLSENEINIIESNAKEMK